MASTRNECSSRTTPNSPIIRAATTFIVSGSKGVAWSKMRAVEKATWGSPVRTSRGWIAPPAATMRCTKVS
jgi:hypothetical protein